MTSQLSEQAIIDAFHSYLKSSLTQAKAERLLDEEILASAETDLMIAGPALCLYFAALRCTTSPPSVPLPRRNKQGGEPIDLSQNNCPPQFMPFLKVWATSVPQIQGLAPEYQHDLARIICGLEPIAQPLNMSLNRIAAELRAVAIEISQRRTFQERYADDLQTALDAGDVTSPAGVAPARASLKASFAPPPSYDQAPTTPTSPHPAAPPQSAAGSHLRLPSPSLASPSSSRSGHSRTPSASSSTSRRSLSPTILPEDAPTIELIRETLYAALGDVMMTTSSLRAMLKLDPSRAHFAAVSLAILSVARSSVAEDGSVRGVLGQSVTIDKCPRELQPFMSELGSIGKRAKEMEAEDDERAMRLAGEGRVDEIPEPQLDRSRRIIERGIGGGPANGATNDDASSRRSLEGRAVQFANRVNALALGMTKLRTFRERQNDVFKVLASIRG